MSDQDQQRAFIRKLVAEVGDKLGGYIFDPPTAEQLSVLSEGVARMYPGATVQVKDAGNRQVEITIVRQ